MRAARRLFAVRGQKGLLSMFPHGFAAEVDSAVLKAEETLQNALSLPPSPQVLWGFDDVSDIICRVTDALELIRNVHPDPNISHEADKEHARASQFIFGLNARHELYAKLDAVLTDRSVMESVGEEWKRMATGMREEFRKGGIHLPDEQREHFLELQSQELTLSSQFQRNISTPGAPIAIPLDNLPRHVLNSLSSYLLGYRDGDAMLDSSEDSCAFGQQVCPTSELREKFYRALNESAHSNKDTLHHLLQTRAQIAELLQMPSHSHYTSSIAMAESPERIAAFLQELTELIRPRVEAERQALLAAKRSAEGGDTLYPWDVPYYQALELNKEPEYDMTSQDASYFSVENSLVAINTLTQSLFGLEICRVHDVPSEETWCADVQKSRLLDTGVASLASLGLQKLVFRWCHRTAVDPMNPTPIPIQSIPNSSVDDHSGDFVGVCYFDANSRENKPPISAKFTIRCGRQSPRSGAQTPIIALILNLDSVITVRDTEVLFHEFGHAIHAILSRTETQHLSGTRGPLDYVEMPSHLFEHFVWDERIMGLIARRDGKPLDLQARRSLIQRHRQFRGMQHQMQIFLSAADMYLHNIIRADDGYDEVVRVLKDIQKQFSATSEHDSRWEWRFTHLVWYGGGYYSYLWSKVMAATIWEKCLQANPLDPEAGAKIHRLLEQGNSRDPGVMLRETIGCDSSIQSFAKAFEF